MRGRRVVEHQHAIVVASCPPRLEPVEDGVGMGRDVVEGPEVEAEAHRIAVALALALAKQWLDVLFEPGGSSGPRHVSRAPVAAASPPVTK